MPLIASIIVLLALWTGQSDERPAYAREADRVEQGFRAYRERLNVFFNSLRGMIDQQPASAAATLPRLQQQDAPPPTAARFGYGVLPRIVDAAAGGPPVSVFSYSWPITGGYIAGENIKIDQAEEDLGSLGSASTDAKTAAITRLILEYRRLLTNQRTIDQYIQ